MGKAGWDGLTEEKHSQTLNTRRRNGRRSVKGDDPYPSLHPILMALFHAQSMRVKHFVCLMSDSECKDPN